MSHRLTISVHPDLYAICRLEPDDAIPDWAPNTSFYSVTRTPHELSIVCREDRVAAGTRAERGRRLMRIEGTLPFSLTGILAAVTKPLAEASISVFAVATYDTDYLLIPAADLERGIAVLEEAGHTVSHAG